MNESQHKLYERLTAAGVSSGEATEICKAFVAPSDEQSVENPTDVDVDRLTKAMEGIRDAFDGNEEKAEVETDTSHVDAAIQEASDIVDAVTKGADALLAEQREQFTALSKALTALTEEVVELRAKVSHNGETVSKSLAAAEEQLNEPVMRKSIGNVEAVPAPGEVGVGPTHQDLISKALDEIRGEDTTDNRKAELRKAISLVESGASADQVATAYGLTARA